MNKILAVGLAVFGLLLTVPAGASAQGMMGFLNQASDSSTIRSQLQEEQEGKKLLDELSQKTSTCSQLSDDNFEKIGEYFMGQSIGDTQRHIVMNQMMQRMMGQSGEEQIHIVMGKRYSGCDTTTAFPAQNAGFMPMMNFVGGNGFYGPGRGFNSVMNFGYFMGSPTSNLFTIIWWVLGVIGIITLVKWVIAKTRKMVKR